MEFNPFVFRDYDIRGIPGKDFDEDFAYELGLAFGNFVEGKRIAVGRDNRKSGIGLKKRMIEGLVDAGKEVWDIGMVPTPVMYFSVSKFRLDGGVQITASHKSSEWNGFKFVSRDAVPIGGSNGIYEIRDMVGRSEKRNKGKVLELDPVPDYIRHLSERFRGRIRARKVLIDVGNGAAGLILENVLKSAGVDARTLNPEPDDTFPSHIPDPHKEESYRDIQAESGYDVGIVLDGDADRCGVADEDGRIVQIDKVLMLLAEDALKRKKGSVVGEVRSSLAFMEFVEKMGGDFVFSKAGHTFILQKIREVGAVFGGEVTGHMFFPLDYYLFDDAIFSALKILEALSLPASRKFSSYPEYFSSPEMSVEVPDEEKFRKMEEIRRIVESKGWEYLGIDGVRVVFPDHWFLIRASNTGPKIKMRFEGKTEEAYGEAERKMAEVLEEAGLKN